MDAAAADPVLIKYVPELTWRSGITERGAERILSMAQNEAIPVSSFGMFSYGGVVRNISEAVFKQWMTFLLNLNTREAVEYALDLFYFYYVIRDSPYHLPNELTLELLTAEPFFVPATARHDNDHEWAEIAKAYLKVYPEPAVGLGEMMLDHFREENTIGGRFHSQTDDVLLEIVRANPQRLWKRIESLLGPPIDTRAFHLSHWLRDGAFSAIFASDVWKWVEKDLEKHPWYLASFVPPVFPGQPDEVSPRELLIRYGVRPDVRRNLMANFFSESWSGSESSHHAAKLDLARQWKRDETNPTVRIWLEEYLASRERRLEAARIEEDRQG